MKVLAKNVQESAPNVHAGHTIHSSKMWVLVVEDYAGLLKYIAVWEELSAAAIEPNPFYEPWMLLPALQFLSTGTRLLFVLVLAVNEGEQSERPILCGFFPLERHSRCKGLPIGYLNLWKHIHCFSCTPLLRREYGREALSAFFSWLASDPRTCSLIEFEEVIGEGPFHQLLIDEFNRRSTLTFLSECHTRPLLRPTVDAEAYLQGSVSKKHRRELSRQEKLFSALGRLEFRTLGPNDEIKPWIESFLKLEASGWKGREGTALASHETERKFFEEMATEGFKRGRLVMLAAYLSGEPISQRCNFLAGCGSFAFKMAFDEAYARFSPGKLLELQNVRWLCARPDIQWMDSCTDAYHPSLSHLWTERRTMQTVLVSTGKIPGDLAVSLMPFLRCLNRKIRRPGPDPRFWPDPPETNQGTVSAVVSLQNLFPSMNAKATLLASKFKDHLRRRGVLRTLWQCVVYLCWQIEDMSPSLRRRKALEADFDHRFGVKTYDKIQLCDLGIEDRQRNDYEATPAGAVNRILKHLQIPYEEFVFVDLGAGLGRAVLMASEFPFKKIIGVEFSPDLARIAEENVANYRSETQQCEDIVMLRMDATQFRLPIEKLVLYMYNPFKKKIMAVVLRNLEESLKSSPRELFVIYYNPVYSRLLTKTGYLEEILSERGSWLRKRYAVFKTV